MKPISSRSLLRTVTSTVMFTTLACGLLALAACGHSDGDKKAGQTLVRINGEEVTVYQLNEELRQTNAKAAVSPEAQRKQMLEALVDRQLLVNEAVHEKLDRDPNVVRAIERAKSQILAQAYLQSKLANAAKPGKEEIDAYYAAHPELFAQRRMFEMRQFVVASKDFSKELNTVMDSAKSLDEVATWLDGHKIEYAKSQAMRASPELPQQILSKMQGAEKTQLFILHSENKTLLMSVTVVKDIPVAQDVASAEIAQFLSTKKNQDIAEVELKRLRAAAKIEYLNQDVTGANDEKAAAAAGTPAATATPAAVTTPAAVATPADPAPSAAPSEASSTQGKALVDPQSLK